ncbi:zinc carboxypeptidase-like [Maniola jurtina]|uniref:zinc carboxypeptidase-like n=1 Tax=Maniola jurtina TaxID=191418 RepID=UPI001E688304|nr:zinc carboxypeptidase-like [Maniola jurtina]
MIALEKSHTKKMNLKITVLVFIFAITLTEAYKSYENYKVYKIVPKTTEHVQVLTDLPKEEYYFWSDIVKIDSDVRILVSPNKNTEFVKYMASVKIEPVLAISNVQELIRAQMQPSHTTKSSKLGSFSWDQYHNLDEIHTWLNELEKMYPDIVTAITIGRSNEGRNITGVIIDFKAGARGNNSLTGMIEGGIHAREWISPATVTWIIKEFLTSKDPDVRFMAETFVWHIFPVINPDGYSYTFTDNRMWRKNRNLLYNPNCTGNWDLGNGIDLNRNFDFLWNTIGASSNPCDETYAGPSPASEPETKAIVDYVLKLKEAGNLMYYLAFHSYSQMILIPYSHLSGTNVLDLPNYGDLYEISIRGAEKLKQKYGTEYEVGTSADILYPVTGASFDWVKGIGNATIVYLFELRDKGEYGFLLPSSQIIPNNEEIMECLVEMDKGARKLGYYSGTSNLYASLLSLVFSVGFLTICQ